MSGVSYGSGVNFGEGVSPFPGVSFGVGVSPDAPSSGPSILTGPSFLNNQNGTVTISWTTDEATSSKVTYGTTTSYGSTSTDAAEVTSHSITITISNDGVYHFIVSDIDDTYTSIDSLFYVDAVLLSQFLILPHFIDVSDPAAPIGGSPFYALSANVADPTVGMIADLRMIQVGSTGTYIRVINKVYESEMRPGVVFARTPTRTGGTVGTYDETNVRYNRITFDNTDTAYAEWLVPSWCTSTLDRVVMYPYGGDANFKLWRNRGGTVTEVLGSTAPGSSVANPQIYNLSDSLIAGDYLRWAQAGFGTGGGGAAFVASIQLFSSTEECTDPRQHFIANPQPINNDGNRISTEGSSMEVAFRMAPTGSATKFFGGAAHQAIDAGSGGETPFTETWTLDGAPWTPEGGMQTDPVNLTRTSDCYYDASNTDIGTLTTGYTSRAYYLHTSCGFTSAVNVDTGDLYYAMTPNRASVGFTDAVGTTDGQVANTKSLAIDAGANFDEPVNSGFSVVETSYPTPDGFSLCAWSQPTGSNTNIRRHQGSNKTYNYLAPASASNVTGINRTGEAHFFHDVTGGVVTKPTLSATSCTVAADGRTILIVPVTLSGGIVGNSGLTFNVGGSPITLDSTTNNGDGTLICVVSLADKILSTDTVTVDVATESLYDAHNIMMTAASGIAVVNDSEQT